MVLAVLMALYWFRPHLSESPAQAQKLASEILPLEIPSKYRPKGTIDWNLASLISLRGAYFEHVSGQGTLMLVEADSRYSHDEVLRQHFQRTLFEEGGGGAPLVVVDHYDRELTVRDQKLPFHFEIGKEANSEKPIFVVHGVVPGPVRREGQRSAVLIALPTRCATRSR